MTASRFRKTSKDQPLKNSGHGARHCAAFVIALLSFALSAHAAPNNGQSANNALGQYDIDNATVVYTKGGVNNGPNQLGLNFPGVITMDSVNHRLFVGDPNNNRVLVYNLNGSNGFVTRVPSNVLGQSSFITNGSAVTQSGMNGVWPGLAFDSVNNRLFVDSHNGVLVFNTATITNGMNASYVLGMPNFTTSTGTTTQSGTNSTAGLALDPTNNLLYAADSGNNRVMVFNVAPGSIANGENASYVIGQLNYTTGTAATTQSGLNNPQGLALDTTNDVLYVGDANNNRVMVFPTASTGGPANGNGENASYELGQAGGSTAFTTGGNGGGQSGLYTPVGIGLDSADQLLYVAENNNDRVTVWNVAPGTIANGENASYVIGQPNFSTKNNATTQSGMGQPTGLFYDSGTSRLFVADRSNNRIEIFNVAAGTIANGENASDGLGQFDIDNATVVYTKGGANNGPNQIGFNLSTSEATALDPVNHRFFVADQSNNRVLVYNLNTDNSFSTNIPANVLGNSDFIGTTTGLTNAAKFNGVAGLAFDSVNNRLFVADTNNLRVLIFSTSTITNGMNASYVLGWNSLTSDGVTTLSQAGLYQPIAFAFDSANELLYVGEVSNDRVTVWNVAPGTIANGENASWVIGQPNFTTNTSATTQSELSKVYGVALDATNHFLYVGDITNNRVMVFATAASGGPLNGNGENASYVLGEPNFTTSTGGVTQSLMAGPMGVAVDPTNNRLFVADEGNQRILVFNVAPSTIGNGENAYAALGQSSFTTNFTNTGPSGFSQPRSVVYDPGSGRLFVTDDINNRIMIFNASALSTNTQGFGIPGYN
jgi:DNA-binding beta-propeller fold protein YncE